jgi:hypothetical protein
MVRTKRKKEEHGSWTYQLELLPCFGESPE